METSTHVDPIPTIPEEGGEEEQQLDGEGEEEEYNHEISPPVATVRKLSLDRE